MFTSNPNVTGKLNLDPNLLPISEECKEALDKHYTMDEMETAIKVTDKEKVPNIDGYGIELLQAFWSELSGPLLQAINYSLKSGKLHNMACNSYISLSPTKSDLNHISSWRGLNIFNLDYRLYSKVVNERLKLVPADIIDPAQVGFMQGRCIGENIIGILNLIEYAFIYDIPAALIAVDFHKAFDVIERNSLYCLLHNMNFGKSFIQHIKLLYTDIRCTVVNSGWSGNYTTRGPFQGTGSTALLCNCITGSAM